MPPVRPRKKRPQPGYELALSVDERSIRIHGVVRLPHVSGEGLRPPALGKGLAKSLCGPTAELVLRALDLSGRVLGRWAWPWRRLVFSDELVSAAGGTLLLRGRPGRRPDGIRLWRIPAPPGVKFLYFTRSDIGPVPPDPGTLVFTERPIALGYIGPTPDRLPRLPSPSPTPAEVKEMLAAIPVLKTLVLLPLPPFFGSIVDHRLLAGDGMPEGHFNIVILGDGFAGLGLTDYDSAATAIADGLLAAKPFRSLANHINIWSVRAESATSGISKCPDESSSRRTFYRVTGCFDGMTGYPGFVGTDHPERVYEAARSTIGLGVDQVHLFIMVVNCKLYGGSADPDQKIAYVTRAPSGAPLVDVAIHECGHVIAGLAEEYIGCSAHDPALGPYPNQATMAQVDAPSTIPWAGLAKDQELSQGVLRAIYKYEKLPDGTVKPPEWEWINKKRLGAYWGCQDFDEGEPDDLAGCRPYDDPRGRNFFRPMWACRMRSVESATLPSVDVQVETVFCRVCAMAIEARIKAACGLP